MLHEAQTAIINVEQQRKELSEALEEERKKSVTRDEELRISSGTADALTKALELAHGKSAALGRELTAMSTQNETLQNEVGQLQHERVELLEELSRIRQAEEAREAATSPDRMPALIDPLVESFLESQERENRRRAKDFDPLYERFEAANRLTEKTMDDMHEMVRRAVTMSQELYESHTPERKPGNRRSRQ